MDGCSRYPGCTTHDSVLRMEHDTNQDATDLASVATVEIEEELLVEEISIDGMCGVY